MLDIIRTIFLGGGESTDLLVQARNTFLTMLDSAERLLIKEQNHVLGGHPPQEILDEARSVDKASNRLEREVRKLLVEHLAFAAHDGPACLVLMSVAKDAERFVDECRSLLLLDYLLIDGIPEAYCRSLNDRQNVLIELLRRTRAVFASDDEAGAIAILEDEKPSNRMLAAEQEAVLDDAELSVRQGVAIYQALYQIQRMRSHLANIASTVVLPLHQIDFAKRRFIEEAKEGERRETDPDA